MLSDAAQPVAFATFDDAGTLAEVIARDESEEEIRGVLAERPAILWVHLDTHKTPT
jgi:hypothetical protein